jgi:hypothetical protein
MTKIVYNACHGGFGLSDAAIERYAELKGITIYKGKSNELFSSYYLVPVEEYEVLDKEAYATGDYTKVNAAYFRPDYENRADPILVQVVEELGEDASGRFAKLEIYNLPKGTLYRIDEYDGYESVATHNDYDWSVA